MTYTFFVLGGNLKARDVENRGNVWKTSGIVENGDNLGKSSELIHAVFHHRSVKVYADFNLFLGSNLYTLTSFPHWRNP